MKPFPPRDVSVADVNTGLMTQIWFSYFQEQSSTSPANQTQARQAIYAAPFDAMAYNGMQINGSMEVSQENGGTARATNGYVCDGWNIYFTGTMVPSAAQVSTGSLLPGFQNCLSASVSTGQVSLGAGDFYVATQSIEGWRVARLNWGAASAQPITISFWSAHTHTGIYSVKVGTITGSRSYVAAYTQAAINVWQYNTITIPGDTTGTWAKDNTQGLFMLFAAACGATYTAPAANTWYGANYISAPGQVNGVSATSDSLRITGVVVLPGIEAPSAARSPFIMRPFDQELELCKRYWQTVYGTHRFTASAGGQTGETNLIFVPEMRASPTLAVVSPTFFSNSAYPGVGSTNTKGSRFIITSLAAGDTYVLMDPVTCDARL